MAVYAGDAGTVSRRGILVRAATLATALLGAIAAPGLGQDSLSSSSPRASDLAGARDRPGLFTQRLHLPAGYCGPLHVHDQDLHGLVLRGALIMGFADTGGGFRVASHPVGSFVAVPAGRPHVEGSDVETEIHLSGIGPLGTTALDSARRDRCVSTR